MKLNEKRKFDDILKPIGLLSEWVWKSPTFYIYNEDDFLSYVDKEYKDSHRADTDEFYRMFEHILLHKRTGLRIGYTTTESYDGEEVTYKLNKIFVITKNCEILDVSDVDYVKEVFLTEKGQINFNEVLQI